MDKARPNKVLMFFVSAWQRYYCWIHELVPVGPLLLIGRKTYTGQTRVFADETVLSRGDFIGSIHLNNARISSLGAGAGRYRTSLQFRKLLHDSLESLARFTTCEGGLAIAAYRGTTWMQPHGLKVGFTTEPLTPGWRTVLLEWQFRALHTCFAPIPFSSRPRNLAARHFWITRTQLRSNFGPDVE